MLILRRVVGKSMLPALRPGQIILGYRRVKILKPGSVVIVRHEGQEKIKRLAQVREGQVFVVGDNKTQSSDSRQFGWLPQTAAIAKVVWPRC